jgi:DNA ligase-1
VGSGFSESDLKNLTALLEPTKTNYNQTPRNYWYCRRLKPNFWLDPSVVVEVDYYDMTISPIYNIGKGVFNDEKGISLRWPIFKRLRLDKTPEMATSVTQIMETYNKLKLMRYDK